MTNLSSFPNFFDLHKSIDPFTVGYDRVFDQLQEISKSVAKTVKYPPYNIKQIDDTKYVIEMAVAGFSKSDIEVTLDGNKLIIKGVAQDDKDDSYIFKGIAGRNFEQTFTLADKIEIKDASVVNGMLKIWLENMVKFQNTVKKISLKGD